MQALMVLILSAEMKIELGKAAQQHMLDTHDDLHSRMYQTHRLQNGEIINPHASTPYPDSVHVASREQHATVTTYTPVCYAAF